MSEQPAKRPSLTVGEALTPKNERPEGLIEKYHVQRANDPLGKHSGCRYFVLDPRHDPLAINALLTYASDADRAGYHSLARDLRAWAKREDEMQEKGSTRAHKIAERVDSEHPVDLEWLEKGSTDAGLEQL